jgi:hypothetical protein
LGWNVPQVVHAIASHKVRHIVLLIIHLNLHTHVHYIWIPMKHMNGLTLEHGRVLLLVLSLLKGVLLFHIHILLQ